MFKYIICLIWIDLLDFSPQATPSISGPLGPYNFFIKIFLAQDTCFTKKAPRCKLDNRGRIVLRLDIIT